MSLITSPISTLIPPQVKIILFLVAVAAVFSSGFGVAWYMRDHADLRKSVEQQKEVIRVASELASATQRADAAQSAANSKVQTVYRDRIKEVVKYVPGDSVLVSNGFVRMWDDSNAMQLSSPARESDATPSGIDIGEVRRQHEREVELCQLNIQQVKGWQDWYRDVSSVAR